LLLLLLYCLLPPLLHLPLALCLELLLALYRCCFLLGLLNLCSHLRRCILSQQPNLCKALQLLQPSPLCLCFGLR
jgi:hypothetical protein